MAIDRAIINRNNLDPNRNEWQTMYKDYRTVNMYTFLKDAYYGVGGFYGVDYSYITPNPTENFYKTRVSVSTYINYFKKFVLAPIKGVFSNNIITKVFLSEDEEAGSNYPLSILLNNIDGMGNDKTSFYKNQLLPNVLRDGVAFLIFDIDNLGNPYLFIKEASELISYTKDETGNIIEYIFDNGTLQKENKTYYRRVIYNYEVFKEEITEDNKTWTVINQTENTLGILPVKPVFDTGASKKDILAKPKAYDIASLGWKIFDAYSDLFWILKKQAYPRLVLNGNINGISYGVDNALVVPPEAEGRLFQPFLLSPDSSIIEIHLKIIEQLKSELFDLMEDNGVIVNAELTKGESGVAKAYTFTATEIAQKNIVRICQDVDNWILETYKVFMDELEAPYFFITEYPTNFQPRPVLKINELLDTAEYYAANNLRLNKAEIEKEIIKLVKPNSGADEISNLFNEINEINGIE